jgi:hypothetical protein
VIEEQRDHRRADDDRNRPSSPPRSCHDCSLAAACNAIATRCVHHDDATENVSEIAMWPNLTNHRLAITRTRSREPAYNHEMRYLVVLASCAGCGFNPSMLSDVDASAGGDGLPVIVDSTQNEMPGGDAMQPAPLHLAPSDGQPGASPFTLSGTVTIDTGALTITGGTLPEGDTFDMRPQLGGGPGLAVLHVGALAVAPGAQVSIVGAQPLVIVAGGDVDVHGVLDAGAHGATPGAGGALPGAGTGAGKAGSHGDNDSDTGGGGGGNGAGGGSGGPITGCADLDPVGAAGSPVGDAQISQLIGAAGGGSASGTACLPVDPGGAGGGALQISSLTKITIESDGSLLAGGGGGHGGTDCNDPGGDVNSGAGGGAGGAIVLQAPAIASSGIIAANGGGGGGSSATGSSSGTAGQDGQAGTTPASGGTGADATGGKGGALAAPTAGGSAGCGANAAGGGGSAGRIAATSGFVDHGTSSPSVTASLPP